MIRAPSGLELESVREVCFVVFFRFGISAEDLTLIRLVVQKEKKVPAGLELGGL